MDRLPYNPFYEGMISSFLEKGHGISQDFFKAEEIELLRRTLLDRYQESEFRLAGIGDRFNFQKEKEIRSAQIRWLNKENASLAEQIFFNRIEDFIHYLNISCFAGIRDFEFHYALYESGNYYERHSDQFLENDQRRFSMVLYLNEDWKEGDGESWLFTA